MSDHPTLDLPPKRQRFVMEYLVHADAARAAREAGYSRKSAARIGHELVNNPQVAAAIKHEQKARLERLGVRADRIVEEYARIAFAKQTDFAEIKLTDDGRLSLDMLPSSEWPDEIASAVQEISETVAPGGSITLKLKMHNKTAALDALRKHVGLDAPTKHEVTGKDGKDLPAASPTYVFVGDGRVEDGDEDEEESG